MKMDAQRPTIALVPVQTDRTFHLTSTNILVMLCGMLDQFDQLCITFYLTFCRTCLEFRDPKHSDRDAAERANRTMRKVEF